MIWSQFIKHFYALNHSKGPNHARKALKGARLLRNQNVNKIFTDHCIFLLWQYEVTSSGKKCETFDFQ